ncbi:MAG: tetratricopeptide repeat protein, partial [Pseudomonadota bacterium]
PDAGGQASDSRVTVAILPFSANEALLPKAMAMHDATRQLVDAAYDVRLLDYAETMLVSSGDLRPDWTIESTFEQVDGQIEAQITVVDIRSSDRIRDTVRASMGDTLTMRALVLASISESLNADRLPKRNSGLTGIVLAAPTNSLEAYDQFAIGRYHYLKYTDEGLATAIEYFTRATELDPQFGGAFSKLGDAYLLAGSHQGFMEPAEAYPKARDALLRAVTLSPDNALALASIGDYYACIESDLELAGRAFDRALKTQPDLLHTGITRYYMLTGREAEGFASVERSLAAFPDSNWEQVIAAHQYLAFGDSKRALELAQAALDRNDESSEAIFVRSLALAELGNTGRAIESFTPLISESRTTPRFKLTYASLLARDNQVDAARQMISLARSGGGRVTETHLAMAYGWLKEADTAFKWLDKAVASREFGLCYLPFSPLWHPLRDDPRFDRILASRYPNLVASTSR